MAGVATLVAACGGSALEGSGPDGTTSEVDEVDGAEEVAEVVDETADDTPLPDGDGEVVEPDTVADTADTVDDGEVDGGPVDWEPLLIGDEGVIDDVVLVTSSLGFAASGTRVLRWDGRLWGPFGVPGGGGVRGVWSDGEVVVAVGDDGLAAMRPVTGGGWRAMPGAPAVTLRAVVGRAGDDVFAAGDDGTVAHWDGESWTERFSSPLIDLHAMWLSPGSSGDEGVYAVGTGGQLVTLVSGVWKAAQIASGGVRLEDIQGMEDGTLVAVGDGHTITIKRPQAPAWQGQVSNDERLRDLRALATGGGGAAGTKLRIFGDAGAVLVGGGTTWNVDTTAGAVVGIKDFVVADGVAGGLVMALTKNGGGIKLVDDTWSTVATTPDAMLTDFAVIGEEVWAVGGKGFLARNGADGWTMIESGTSQDLFGLTAVADDALVAVGAKGTILGIALSEDDGGGEAVTVTPLAAPAPVDLYAVARSGAGVMACGRGGTIVRIGEDVSLAASGTTADLRAIREGGDGRVWVGGAFGTLLRSDAEVDGFEAMPSGVGGSLSGLARTEDGVLAVGDNGVILRADAVGVEIEYEDPGKFLYAVATTPSGGAVAAGSGGLVLVDQGDGWAPELVSERGATFDAVFVSADGATALVGGSFRLMHVETRRMTLEAR